jgi:CBS domain-containing protein
MTTRNRPALADYAVSRHGTLLDAADVIQRNRSRAAVVLDGEKVFGVVSEGDILRALLGGADIHAPLEAFTRIDFRYLTAHDLGTAAGIMRARGVSLLPVVDENFRLTGAISTTDVLDHLMGEGGAA